MTSTQILTSPLQVLFLLLLGFAAVKSESARHRSVQAKLMSIYDSPRTRFVPRRIMRSYEQHDAVPAVQVVSSCSSVCQAMKVSVSLGHGVASAQVVAKATASPACTLRLPYGKSKGTLLLPFGGCGSNRTVKFNARYPWLRSPGIENYVTVHARMNNGRSFSRDYHVGCPLAYNDANDVSGQQRQDMHYTCKQLNKIENYLSEVDPGQACLLNDQCPDHAYCVKSHRGSHCRCDTGHGFVAVGGECEKIAMAMDPCREDEDCERPYEFAASQKRSPSCSSNIHHCVITTRLGGFCLSHAECTTNDPSYVCDLYRNRCIVGATSPLARRRSGSGNMPVLVPGPFGGPFGGSLPSISPRALG